MLVAVYFVFFFQAEDGIRDWSVTGVQTCALPICILLCSGETEFHAKSSVGHARGDCAA